MRFPNAAGSQPVKSSRSSSETSFPTIGNDPNRECGAARWVQRWEDLKKKNWTPARVTSASDNDRLCVLSRRFRRPATVWLPWDQREKKQKMSGCFKRGLLMSVPFFFYTAEAEPQNSDVCTAHTINKDSLLIHALGVQCSACHSLFYSFFFF